MAIIEVRVCVHLPHDANGVSAQPGQVIEVDTDNAYVRGYLETGLLYPLTPLEFSLDMQPPMTPSAADAQADGEADAGEDAGPTVGPFPDAPQHAAQAPDTGEAPRGLLPPYDVNTVAALQAEAKARGIGGVSNATKDTLVELLEADDAER
jgi:hypothetical protein